MYTNCIHLHTVYHDLFFLDNSYRTGDPSLKLASSLNPATFQSPDVFVRDAFLLLRSSDFTAPLSVPGGGAKESESVNEEAVAMIVSMGFTQDQAIKALKATVSVTFN